MSIPTLSLPTTFLVLLGTMVLRYLSLSGAFFLFDRRTPGRKKQHLQDIKWSLLSSAVFASSGTILVELWRAGRTGIYLELQPGDLWYLPVSLILLLVLQDSYFYWTHRLLHSRPLARFHRAHHHSVRPSAWTSFSFHPVEAAIQAIALPLLLILVPVHLSVLVAFLLLMTFLGILNHLERDLYPAVLERRIGLINASHHQFHHLHQGQNFGLYFTWWDRILGTEGKR